ncbi:MAG: class I SAM-dependent methyltransferase [Bdellovibrionales bacterium]|nr:class I SAM-dependent methyltransferase [Bdellovibrionales bacterium]
MNDSHDNDQAWFKRWFNQEYLDLYDHRTDQAACHEAKFIEQALMLKPENRLLDVACGNGRHLLYLKSQGYDVFGADLSFDLLKIANQSERFPGRLVRYDMRWPCFKTKSFDAVISMFTSFGYFASDAEHLAVLIEINKILKNQGRLFFDFFNIDYVLKNIKPKTEKETSLGRVCEYREYNSETKRVKKIINLLDKNKTYTESVRAFNLDELKKMFIDSDFIIEEIYGDFSGAKFSIDSERLIICAKKK